MVTMSNTVHDFKYIYIYMCPYIYTCAHIYIMCPYIYIIHVPIYICVCVNISIYGFGNKLSANFHACMYTQTYCNVQIDR